MQLIWEDNFINKSKSEGNKHNINNIKLNQPKRRERKASGVTGHKIRVTS